MERFKVNIVIFIPLLLLCSPLIFKNVNYAAISKTSLNHSPDFQQSGQKAKGTVYHDKNTNGIRDNGEPGLPGIRVSDQISVTLTDNKGSWELPERDEAIYFVIKPRGYMTGLSKDKIPRFYYLHKNKEESKLQGPSVPRSGPLPQSIDFPLVEQEEPDKFDVIFMGDPQPANIEHVNYLAHDILGELAGTSAAFAVTLGDITYDELDLYASINETCGAVGIPFYNTPGNHDANYDGINTFQHYETWRITFGPRYYSFDYGPVHFVILSDVLFPQQGNSYKAGLGETQLEWIRQDLANVPENQLVVFSMHIPLKSAKDNSDFAKLYELLQDRPNTLSFSAHTHNLTHFFLDENFGWKRPEPHHHINAGAACGRWWRGEKDETDIPHSTCADGTPNGYFVVTFEENKYSARYKAARRPADYQMQIYAPDEVKQWRLEDTPVFVNVFNGSILSSVQMSVGKNGKWINMKFAPQVDPLFSKVSLRESGEDGAECNHIWEGRLPEGLSPGGHIIRIKTVDMSGLEYSSSRIIRVSDIIPPVNSSYNGINVTKEKVVNLQLSTDYPGGVIRYTLDGTDPEKNSPVAEESINLPMDVFTTKIVKTRIIAQNGKRGEIKNIVFVPVKENYAEGSNVKPNTTTPSRKYAQGDMSILVNGKFGGPGYNQGWLGWEGSHADFIIDIKETQSINRVFTRALTEENSWIFYPKAIKVYLSQDGINWSESTSVITSKPVRTYGSGYQEFSIKVSAVSARYIRIFAESILKNPEWHKMPGKKCWIFLDEVIIE